MQDCSFKGTQKDYSVYINCLRSIPIRSGSTILDFGCSWGYGSWQLTQAGYTVYSCEISQPRAAYAAQKLNCDIRDPRSLPEKVGCVFSAHVIEHLTNPRELWTLAREVLKPGGKVVTFCPNGSPLREHDKNYHKWWGQVHPLLISPEALKRMGQEFGFTARSYSSPYDLVKIAAGEEGDQTGEELLVIASS